MVYYLPKSNIYNLLLYLDANLTPTANSENKPHPHFETAMKLNSLDIPNHVSCEIQLADKLKECRILEHDAFRQDCERLFRKMAEEVSQNQIRHRDELNNIKTAHDQWRIEKETEAAQLQHQVLLKSSLSNEYNEK